MIMDIHFRAMNDAEFDDFIKRSVEDYSNDLIKAGTHDESNALEAAKKSFEDLIPEGRETADNYLCMIENDAKETVGLIWYKKHTEDVAFICDIEIDEKHRRKGYAKKALTLLESEAKAIGCDQILLHVFRFNSPARALYEKVGYQMVQEDGESVYMLKGDLA